MERGLDASETLGSRIFNNRVNLADCRKGLWERCLDTSETLGGRIIRNFLVVGLNDCRRWLWERSLDASESLGGRVFNAIFNGDLAGMRQMLWLWERGFNASESLGGRILNNLLNIGLVDGRDGLRASWWSKAADWVGRVVIGSADANIYATLSIIAALRNLSAKEIRVLRRLENLHKLE